MQTHTMRLMPNPFDKIKNGSKKIELRLYDEKRQIINIGDHIIFEKEPEREERVETKVTALLRYENFSDLFDDFPSEIFGGRSKEDLLLGVHKFYSKEKEKEYGVLGIKIELL